jgi:hypothetical protein
MESEQNMAASEIRVGWGGTAVVATWLMSSCSGQVCQLPSQIWYSVRQAGAWSQGAAIGGVTGTIYTSSSLAVDAMGRATLVYAALVSGRYSIYATTYASGSWSTPQVIETDNTNDALDPIVAVDANGVAYAAWTQQNQIWANRLQPGVGWGTAVRVDQGTIGSGFPWVASGPAGAAIVVWIQNGSVYSSRFSGSSWATPSIAGAAGGAPRVTMHSDTSAIAAWQRNGGDFVANRNTGAWGTAAPIDAVTGTVVDYFALRTPPDGKTLAVWVQDNDVYQARFDPTQGWGAAFRIENGGGQCVNPTLAVGTDSSALAAWGQPSPGAATSPWVNVFQPNSGWAAAHVAKPADGIDGFYPVAFFDPQGNAFGVLWLAAPSGYESVYSAVYK